jgi:hypothetical protein
VVLLKLSLWVRFIFLLLDRVSDRANHDLGFEWRHLNSAVRDVINDSFCKHPLPKTQAGHPEPRFDQLKLAEADA